MLTVRDGGVEAESAPTVRRAERALSQLCGPFAQVICQGGLCRLTFALSS